MNNFNFWIGKQNHQNLFIVFSLTYNFFKCLLIPKVTLIMLLFYFSAFVLSVDVKQIFRGEWNANIFEPNLNGEIGVSKFYHFNLTEKVPNKLDAEIYTGDFPISVNETDSEEREYIGKFEIEISGEQNGTINLLEPYNDFLAEYNFIDTFNGYIGAFGVFNESMSYSANIINIATIHITLYSFDKKIFKEILLTRIQYPKVNHWYDIITRNSFVFVAFIISYTLFKFIGTITEPNAPKDPKQKKKTK